MQEAEPVLDIQHDTDPEPDRGTVRRIPHIGHALLFFALAVFCVSLCGVIAFSLLRAPGDDTAATHPGTSLAALGAAYVLLLSLAIRIFPRMWERSFLHGIQWNVLAAHRRWLVLVVVGIALSASSQFADHFVRLPEKDPIELLMRYRLGAWSVTVFGIVIAPLIEEIAFRGFLLPALATAYDWLALERTPQALRRWETSAGHSVPALFFAAIFSTIPFALLHAGQLSHAWGAVSVIFVVGLILALVRIRTHSVACSTLVHATYNATIFAVVLFQTGGYRHLEKM